MRRWLAIAMAALVALSIGGLSGGRAPSAEAGPPSGLTLSIDCNVSTPGIQVGGLDCTYPSGTTTYAADVYVTNGSGGPAVIAAFNITLSATSSPLTLVPTSPPCSPPRLNCNPDFEEALGGTGWACDPVLPDQAADPDMADSLISCFNSNVDTTPIANGATAKMFRVSYTSGDGLTNLSLKDVNIFNELVEEIGSCNPDVTTPATCNIAQVLIGAALSTPTPTNTPTPTFTPCSGGSCPTKTSQAYVTVTPTPCPEGSADCPTATPDPNATPTVAGAPTEAPPAPPPPPPAGQAPGGAGAGRITLPDTGESDNGGSGLWIALLAGASALGAAGIASGLFFSARRRQEED